MSDHDQSTLAGTSITRHLLRGVAGFGLIAAALVLTQSVGPAALLLAPLGMVALRGCPTCWIVGLVQSISAGRLQRTCSECTLREAPPDGDAVPMAAVHLTRVSDTAASRRR